MVFSAGGRWLGMVGHRAIESAYALIWSGPFAGVILPFFWRFRFCGALFLVYQQVCLVHVHIHVLVQGWRSTCTCACFVQYSYDER